MFTWVLGRYVASAESYQYPNLSEGADRVGGQLRGDKECPFSGVTKSGRVWRKVPERARRIEPRHARAERRYEQQPVNVSQSVSNHST